jgi:hypothetical protein
MDSDGLFCRYLRYVISFDSAKYTAPAVHFFGCKHVFRNKSRSQRNRAISASKPLTARKVLLMMVPRATRHFSEE